MTAANRRPRAYRLATSLLAVGGLAIGWMGTPSGMNAADPPDVCTAATVASATNRWLSGAISSSTDVDWYRFTIGTGTRAMVTLGDLPRDYDVTLYGTCGSTPLASSTRSGTQYDEIYRYLPAGTYRVRVAGYLGAYSAAPYVLRLRTLASGIPILSYSAWTDSAGYLHVAGEVLNNTADWRRWIEVDATLRNSDGAILARAVGYPKVPVLAPWVRAPFEIVTPKPAGYWSTRLAICTPTSTGGCSAGQVTTAGVTGLSVTGATSYVDASGRRHYTGAVVNGSSSTARLTRAVVSQYDARGQLKGLGSTFTAPTSIAVGGSAPYDAIGTSSAAANRFVAVPVGTATGCTTTPRYGGVQENMTPPLSRASASGRVALTFDMGGRMTPAVKILKLLVANNVCATIFPTGSISRTAEGQAALAIVKAHPELFELGNHTMHHCDMVRGGGGAPGATDAAFCATLAPSPTEAEVKQELIDADTWIRTYTGMATKPFWRAPYGVSNLTVRTWAAELGWTKQVKWDVDTIDWRPISEGGPTAQSITLKVVNGAKSGSIVLMHLGGYETPDALQSMIDGLRSRGFTLTTISDLAQ